MTYRFDWLWSQSLFVFVATKWKQMAGLYPPPSLPLWFICYSMRPSQCTKGTVFQSHWLASADLTHEKKCVVISRCPLLAALVFRVLQVEAKPVCWRIWRWWIHLCFCSAVTSLLLSFITWHISTVQYVFPQTAVFCVEYRWCHFHLSRHHIWMPSSTHRYWLHCYWCVPLFSAVLSCREIVSAFTTMSVIFKYRSSEIPRLYRRKRCNSLKS